MAKTTKKSSKLKPTGWIAVGVLVVGVVILLVNGIKNHNKAQEDENKVNISVNDANLANVGEVVTSHHELAGGTTVEIQLSDCAVVVGNSFKAVALVTPYDTEKSIVWASSNNDVLEITTDGIVTVKAVGTATISATVGDVTDAVVIEGIAEIAKGSSNGFPVYTVSAVTNVGSSGGSGLSGSSGGSGSSGSAGSIGGSGSSGSLGSSGSAGSIGGSGSSGSSGSSSSSGSSGSVGNIGGSGSSGSSGGSGSSGSAGSIGGSGSSGSSSSSGSSGSAGSSGGSGSSGSSGSSSSGSGLSSDEIGGQLGGMGFSQTVSNVYVCQDGEKYYGEIVTQPEVTIIYIKERCDTFDARIKSVLSNLLPKQNGQVWNNYISASTDRTFTVEDRMVRIVVATNGGHSQIVIYN